MDKNLISACRKASLGRMDVGKCCNQTLNFLSSGRGITPIPEARSWAAWDIFAGRLVILTTTTYSHLYLHLMNKNANFSLTSERAS
jgi:hypothetical protein